MEYQKQLEKLLGAGLCNLRNIIAFMARVMRVAWYAVLLKGHNGIGGRVKLGYFATEDDADVCIDSMWPWLASEGFLDWTAHQTIAFAPHCMRVIR